MLDEGNPGPESRTATSTPSELGCPGADQQFACPLAGAAHRLHGVDDQVENHLLELNPISLNERQALCELRPHRDAVLHCFATGQGDNLEDSVVDRNAVLPWRRFPDQRTDPTDDLARSFSVLLDITERLLGFLEIWPLRAQPAQTGLGIGDSRGDGLVHFMCDRGGELPHCRNAVRVRQRHLNLAVSLLTQPRFGFRTLLLCQIEHESDDAIAFERRRSDEHRNAAAVFPEVLFLERLNRPELVQFRSRLYKSAVPFRGRHPLPVDAVGSEILMVVSQHVEKRIVGLDNLVVDSRDEDADNIRVEQTPILASRSRSV